MKKEKRIYLKEVFRSLLIGWKTILIWMIIFAVLANAFFCIKYYRAILKTVEQQEQGEVAKVDVSTYKDALSDSDAKTVEENFKIYLKYKSAYDKIINYYNKSVKINLDPGNVPTIKLEYSIENCDSPEDFVESLSLQVQNSALAQEIIDATNLETEESYIWELVEIESISDIKENSNSDILVEETDKKSSMMLVQIEAEDIETAKKMAELLDKEINLKSNGLKSKYGDFTLELIEQIENNIVDTDLLLKQQDYSGRLNSLNSYFENLQSSMTDGQKNYYNALIDDYESENEIDQIDDDIIENVTMRPQMKYFSIKYIILGLFIGIVLAAVYCCFPYIFGRKLSVIDEISDYFGLNVLGVLESNKRIGKINRRINLLFDKNKYNNTEEEKVQLICTQIIMALKKKDIGQIYLTSTLKIDDISDVEKKIENRLNNMGIHVTIGNSLLYNRDSLEGIMKADSVIFVEKIGVSDLDDIYKEIEVCQNYNVLQVGVIILER